MRIPTSRTLRVTALVSAAAFALLPMASASAATANSRGYGAQADVLNGTVHVGPLATSTFPNGGNSTLVPLNIPAIADVAAVYSKTSGDLAASTSHAEAGTANVGVLGTALTGYSISADAVSATCDATGTDASGSTTVVNLKVGTNSVINATFTDQQNVLTIPNVASVIINEKLVGKNGEFIINALHITLLGGNAGDIILGHVVCGPNVPVAGVSAFSFQDLPLILGGLALAVVIGFGIRTGVRRLGTAA